MTEPTRKAATFSNVDASLLRRFEDWADASNIHRTRALELAMGYLMEVFPEGKEDT